MTAILVVAVGFLSCTKSSNNRDFDPDVINGYFKGSDSVPHTADSLVEAGLITPLVADLYKMEYFDNRNPALSLAIGDSALGRKVQTDQDRFYRFVLVSKMVEAGYGLRHYETALKMAQQQIEDADMDFVKSHALIQTTFLMLYSNMANCNIVLERYDEGERYLQTVMQMIDEFIAEAKGDSISIARFESNRTQFAVDAMLAYINMGDFKRCQVWMERAEQYYKQIVDNPRLNKEHVNAFGLQIGAMKAYILERNGHHQEAAQAYEEFTKNPLSGIYAGRVNSAFYLNYAHRYEEAERNVNDVEDVLKRFGMKMDLQNIRLVKHKFTAHLGAEHRDSALAVATRIINSLDSADVWEKRDKAAEMATLYSIHEKELAVNEAKSETRIHRILLAATFVLILLIGYQLWHAHKYNRILTAKNKKLYAEIEQHRQEQQKEMEQLKAAPETMLTTEQILYRRLCALMDEQQPYTNEALNRDALALLLGSNAKYVEQAIRECSKGETVSDFINRYRLEHVARLLKTTDDPIAVIGEISGIPSRATLARLFRMAYGMTPSEYRKI